MRGKMHLTAASEKWSTNRAVQAAVTKVRRITLDFVEDCVAELQPKTGELLTKAIFICCTFTSS